MGKSYSLGGNFILMVGLRLHELNFEPAVTLVQSDRIILSEKEWLMLISIKSTLLQFYHDGSFPTQPLGVYKKNVILFNSVGKEIVLKNQQTWHTIRINRHHFENLLNFSPLITKYVDEELNRKKAFLSFELSTRVMNVANNFAVLTPDALVSDESIKEELLKTIDTEVFIVYSNTLVNLVKDAILISKELLLHL